MAKKKTSPLTFTLILTLIMVVVVGSLIACFNMAMLPYGKIGRLAELDPAQANPKTIFHYLYGSTPIKGNNYSFSPPISLYRAIDIGLRSDDWTAQSLKNMTVSVSLSYYIYYTNVTELYQVVSKENITLMGRPDPNTANNGSGFEYLYEVTSPVINYKPQFFNGVTLRYVWTVDVEPSSGAFCIPPPGYYQVDAATGELIPTGPLI